PEREGTGGTGSTGTRPPFAVLGGTCDPRGTWGDAQPVKTSWRPRRGRLRSSRPRADPVQVLAQRHRSAAPTSTVTKPTPQRPPPIRLSPSSSLSGTTLEPGRSGGPSSTSD